jgi:hypothetical protein
MGTSFRTNYKTRIACKEYIHLGRKNLALYSASVFVGNHWSRDRDLLDPNLNFSVEMNLCKKKPEFLLFILYPRTWWLPLEEDCPTPSKTTRSPMSFIAKLRRPRPSPSPKGSPESSKSALNDSMCGAINSFNIGKAEPSVGGCLKADSRAKVLKVSLDMSKFCLHNLRVPSKTRDAFEAPTK